MIRNSGQTSTASCKVYFYISIANYRSTIEAWFQVLSMALLTSIPACNIPCFYPPIDYVNDSSWLTWRSQPINKPHKHRSCPIFPIRLIQVLTLGYIASMRSAKLVMCSMHVYISYKYVLVWLETVFIYCQTAVTWCTSSTAFHDPLPYSKSMFVAALLVVRLIALRHRVPSLVFNLNFVNFIHWIKDEILCVRAHRVTNFRYLPRIIFLFMFLYEHNDNKILDGNAWSRTACALFATVPKWWRSWLKSRNDSIRQLRLYRVAVYKQRD